MMAHCENVYSLIPPVAFFSLHVVSRVRIYVCEVYHVSMSLSAVSCLSSEFRCYSGECVSDTLQCSGWGSCSDGSDEDGCPYSKYFTYTLRNPCTMLLRWTDLSPKYYVSKILVHDFNHPQKTRQGKTM